MSEELDYMVETVRKLQDPSDTASLEDLAYYIKEHFDVDVSVKDLDKYYNPVVEDIKLQFKHTGLL